MSDSFKCGHCRTINRFTLYSIKYWREHPQAAMQRCVRCGAAHGCRDFTAEVIPPLMQPHNYDLRESPWQPPAYRPVVAGLYQCEFRDFAHRLALWWNGVYFQVNERDSRKVNMRTLYRWRGSWA